MVKSCCDSYHTQFSDFPDLLRYHERIRADSRWERTEVKKLEVAALDKASPLFSDTTSFDPCVSRDAISWPSSSGTSFSRCAIPPTRACWTAQKSAARPCPNSPARNWRMYSTPA